MRPAVAAPFLARAQRPTEREQLPGRHMGQIVDAQKLCPWKYSGFPRKARTHHGAGGWSHRVTCLLLALLPSAYCCSSICLSWHPGPGHRPLFLGRPLGARSAASRQEAGHSGLKTDLHSVRNRAPLCSGGHRLLDWPRGGGPDNSAAHMPPLKAARRCGYSRDKSVLSIHGY